MPVSVLYLLSMIPSPSTPELIFFSYPLLWSFELQSEVTLFTTEAKYISFTQATCDHIAFSSFWVILHHKVNSWYFYYYFWRQQRLCRTYKCCSPSTSYSVHWNSLLSFSISYSPSHFQIQFSSQYSTWIETLQSDWMLLPIMQIASVYSIFPWHAIPVFSHNRMVGNWCLLIIIIQFKINIIQEVMKSKQLKLAEIRTS